ncbi:hypothetical protein MPH_03229 [Macrophomina phaseolina MS6]|uniref:Uncharacterized protein n=1 Tax=Macrophomina phaseolina (strain MS6) TaxID=1126212 RepID=K2RA53_MACPH|nr:hypothetical protein MPH_03229 [Macrophomina phaseolina MS6]
MAVSVEEINDARNLNGKGAADKKKVQLDALYTELHHQHNSPNTLNRTGPNTSTPTSASGPPAFSQAAFTSSANGKQDTLRVSPPHSPNSIPPPSPSPANGGPPPLPSRLAVATLTIWVL